MAFDFTPREKILLEALVRHGKYGSTVDEVVSNAIVLVVREMKDVRLRAIAGFIMLGKDERWIIETLRPGHEQETKIELTQVKKNWKSYSNEPLPQG